MASISCSFETWREVLAEEPVSISSRFVLLANRGMDSSTPVASSIIASLG